MHRHDHALGVLVVGPQSLERRADHAGAEATPDGRRVADQIVDRHRAGRHRGEWRQLVEVLGVVVQERALQQPERYAVKKRQKVFVRFLPARGRSEVALHGRRGCLMVPPAGHVRLRQPARQQREVIRSDVSPGHHSTDGNMAILPSA
jgi:hypothetical protein